MSNASILPVRLWRKLVEWIEHQSRNPELVEWIEHQSRNPELVEWITALKYE